MIATCEVETTVRDLTLAQALPWLLKSVGSKAVPEEQRDSAMEAMRLLGFDGDVEEMDYG